MYKKSISLYQLQKHLTKMKKRKFHFWKEVGSQTIQEITERIDKGYKLFFKKNAKRPPSFKSKYRYKSFTMKQAGWSIVSDNQIRIGKQIYKFSKSRDIEGDIKLVTIKQNSLGEFFVIFITNYQGNKQELYPKTGKSAGFDFGLKTFLVSSDGNEIQSPQFLKKNIKKVKKLSNKFSTKVKGSNNRAKARRSLAKAHDDVFNQRENYHWQLANQLVREYDVLCFEDLNMNAMKKLWGRKISDLSFSSFLDKVKYLCLKRGKEFVQIDRFSPTTKICNVCDNTVSLSLSDRS
jgi:putative transposase